MQVTVNGQTRNLTANDGDYTLSDLINVLGFSGTRYAIEVDGAIVPRSKHSSYAIQDKQHIEIIQAVGGG